LEGTANGRLISQSRVATIVDKELDDYSAVRQMQEKTRGQMQADFVTSLPLRSF
jgi:hypothetical protein